MGRKGLFILFEGVDCVGKTTYAKHLNAYLNEQGHPSKYISFPQRQTPVGQLLNTVLNGDIILNEKATYLTFIANRLELMDEMNSMLVDGTNIVVDRYVYSGLAYGKATGLTREFMSRFNEPFIQPDIVFYTRPDEIHLDALYSGREIYETSSFQTMVLEEFESMCRKHDWYILHREHGIDRINKCIEVVVRAHLDGRDNM